MIPDQERLARIRLSRTEGVGPVSFQRLLLRYGSAREALLGLPADQRFAPPALDAIERERAALARIGGRFLVWGDGDYPALLAELLDAPPVLSFVGDVSLLGARAVAIVGSRNASLNGQRIAGQLAAELAAQGLVVVSGLARGIDTAAHQAAMSGGKTVAVVAGGLDVAYPPENAELQAKIGAVGAVVTEAPFGTDPQSRHFPRRNRIIAGLSLGVVVVEAAPQSGTLITAREAQEAGREIFAVPGSPLDPRARGANDLLRQGAILTETAADVLAHLPERSRSAGLFQSAEFRTPGFAEAADMFDSGADQVEEAKKIIPELLGPTPTDVDDLLRGCQFSASVIMAALLELELDGRIVMPGGRQAALAESW
jgi:DNA processing protein